MKLIDLTRRLDPDDLELLPEWLRPFSSNFVPTVHHVHPAGEGADVMCAIFGCTRNDLPDGEGWGDEMLSITTHLGTHVDAPLHYGSTCEGRPARTIDQIGLAELVVPCVVLDVREAARPGEGITVDALAAAAERAGGIPSGGGALVRTGQERYTLADDEYFSYPGMTRDGTLFLADQGARVLGTDALGWDRPFGVMATAFRETGDAGQIWDGHFAGREREVFIVQQMANLAELPPGPVTVGFFPMYLAGCSAAPARVVAMLDLDPAGSAA